MSSHHPKCTWPDGKPWLRFSTDGTRLGAEIAHTFGTTSEQEIAERGDEALRDLPGTGGKLTGMAEEQADWDSDE